MIPRRAFLTSVVLGAASGMVAAEPRIRIAQIGTQHAHAAGKMEAIRRLSDLYEVVGLAGSAGALDKASPAYAGLPELTESELLALPGLQAVAVETSIEDACSTAVRAVRAGKHVHLDKPGALDHGEFKAMRLAAEQRGITVQMGYMLRYNPAFQMLFQAHREGWFGDILEVDAMMGKLADERTRRAIGALPGSGMFELACHLIDAAVTLLGKPRQVIPVSTPTRSRDSVADNQAAVLVYPNASVTVRCNHADPFGGPRRRFQVAGTRGAMEILPLESGKATLWLDEARGPWKKGVNTVVLPVPQGRYDAEFVDLAQVIRGSKKLAWDAAHDIAVHETALRAAGVLA
jgi:predicted dehydrogenase